MLGFKSFRSAQIILSGIELMQGLHYEISSVNLWEDLKN